MKAFMWIQRHSFGILAPANCDTFLRKWSINAFNYSFEPVVYGVKFAAELTVWLNAFIAPVCLRDVSKVLTEVLRQLLVSFGWWSPPFSSFQSSSLNGCLSLRARDRIRSLPYWVTWYNMTPNDALTSHDAQYLHYATHWVVYEQTAAAIIDRGSVRPTHPEAAELRCRCWIQGYFNSFEPITW